MTIRIDKVIIESALEIYQIIKSVLKREHKLDREKEHFWVMALNKAHRVLNLELVAFGANNMLKSRPADILAIPLQKQAQKLILIHNHPSGSIKPSDEEKDFTDLVIQACNLMRTPVLEHVIITEHSYFSFQETGLLKELEASTKYLLSYELKRKLHKELQEAKEEIEQESKIKIKQSLKKGREEGKVEGLKEGKAEGLEQGIATGKAKGIEEGLKAGIQLGKRQGEEKGLKKGLKEGEKKRELEIAKQMLLKGLDIELICQMTGLSREDLARL